MSRVQIYSICKETGNVKLYAEEKNAIAGAFLMWIKMNEKYHFDDITFRQLWKATSEGKLNEQDTIAVVSTFDDFWIKKEHILEVANAWDNVWNYIEKERSQVDNTIQRVASVLKKMAKDPEVNGVCFNHTSVCPNPWICRIEDEERIPFNFNEHTVLVNGKEPLEIFEYIKQ